MKNQRKHPKCFQACQVPLQLGLSIHKLGKVSLTPSSARDVKLTWLLLALTVNKVAPLNFKRIRQYTLVFVHTKAINPEHVFNTRLNFQASVHVSFQKQGLMVAIIAFRGKIVYAHNLSENPSFLSDVSQQYRS